ncbi:hypothetical protein [Haliangium sp.]|uniref:hypothetical protein n=1 Tax=Haliangium sp. TaxID=2663208 RepID=UPI003D112929
MIQQRIARWGLVAVAATAAVTAIVLWQGPWRGGGDRPAGADVGSAPAAGAVPDHASHGATDHPGARPALPVAAPVEPEVGAQTAGPGPEQGTDAPMSLPDPSEVVVAPRPVEAEQTVSAQAHLETQAAALALVERSLARLEHEQHEAEAAGDAEAAARARVRIERMQQRREALVTAVAEAEAAARAEAGGEALD